MKFAWTIVAMTLFLLQSSYLHARDLPSLNEPLTSEVATASPTPEAPPAPEPAPTPDSTPLEIVPPPQEPRESAPAALPIQPRPAPAQLTPTVDTKSEYYPQTSVQAQATAQPQAAPQQAPTLIKQPLRNPYPSGLAPLITGAVFMGLAVVNAGFAAVCLSGMYGDEETCMIISFVAAGVFLTVGTPILIVGAVKRKKHLRWRRENALSKFGITVEKNAGMIGWRTTF